MFVNFLMRFLTKQERSGTLREWLGAFASFPFWLFLPTVVGVSGSRRIRLYFASLFSLRSAVLFGGIPLHPRVATDFFTVLFLIRTFSHVFSFVFFFPCGDERILFAVQASEVGGGRGGLRAGAGYCHSTGIPGREVLVL